MAFLNRLREDRPELTVAVFPVTLVVSISNLIDLSVSSATSLAFIGGLLGLGSIFRNPSGAHLEPG